MAPERPAGPTTRLPVALKQRTKIIPQPFWVSLPCEDAGGCGGPRIAGRHFRDAGPPRSCVGRSHCPGVRFFVARV